MLGKKQGALEASLEKYENGVIRLQNTTQMVGELEETIKITAITVAEAKIEAQEQAAIVGLEKAKVDKENDFAEVKAAEANKVATEVNAKKQSVQKDLDEAIPLVEKAEAALKGLKEDDFK